jgi:hypothetical protein
MLSDGNADELIEDPIVSCAGPLSCSLPLESRDSCVIRKPIASSTTSREVFPRILASMETQRTGAGYEHARVSDSIMARTVYD